MERDATRVCELLVGLGDVEGLGVDDEAAEPLRVHIRRRAPRPACEVCGGPLWSDGEREVALVDLPAFGCPVVLVWRKRRWRCPDQGCEAGTVTEQDPAVVPPRERLTARAGRWATRQAGRARPVGELAESAVADGCKTVVFSYMLDPLRHLRKRLVAAHGNIAAMLTGEQPLDRRRRSVERFKTHPDCWVLLASTRVASEGLTLTEASRVIFVNRWWNPSTNSQAVDRVVRIGQTEPVIVHYLTCADTVEDRLQPLLDRKEMTFDQLVDALQHRPDAVRELLAP